MTPDTILVQLYRIADSAEFPYRSGQLVEDWIGAGVGPEAIAPVLRFMEEHPEIDYGRPGALVHFLERLGDRGYGEQLTASFARRPTAHTALMLDRHIASACEPEVRQHLLALMRDARQHPLADAGLRDAVKHLLREGPAPRRGYRGSDARA
ncbi:MAG: hypothetical protein QM767_19135 [Anaeromyxobacter sp.]